MKYASALVSVCALLFAGCGAAFFGRAIIAGSQAFSLVGAFDAGLGFWMLFALLVCCTVLDSMLRFRSASKEAA